MVKVVIDTVVFVRSLINPYSFWGKLIFQHAHSYRLFLSKPVLLEVLEVLQRPELTQKFKSIQGLDKAKILEIISQAEIVNLPDIPAISRDIKDNKFLATAKEAKAEYLVTEDEDMLVLKEYEGTQIIKTEKFLEILSKTTGEIIK